MKFLAAFVNFLTRTDTTLTEIWSALLLLLWGVWFMLGPSEVQSGSLYGSMIHVFPPKVWAIPCFLLGAAGLLGSFLHNICIRRVSSFGIFLFFVFVSGVGALADLHGLYVPTYLVAAFVAGVAYLKLSLATAAKAV